MSIIRKRIHISEMILKMKFPDVKIGFYLRKRKSFLHIGLDQLLTSLECDKELTEEIYRFKFKLIHQPLVVPTVRWKFDYILIKKK